MLCRLPITLARLNAGNNSEKLKIEIKQLLYSLYWSKNLQNKFIKVLSTLFKIETIFVNTENSKTNQPHIYKLDLTDNLNLENGNKAWL